MLLASSAGALGAAALSSGPAYAASSVSDGAHAPVVDVGSMQPDGTVTVKYTDPVNVGEAVDPSGSSLTVSWDPQTTVPPGAHQPAPPASVKLTNGVCTGTGPVTCVFSFPPALLFDTYMLNGTYQLQASGRDCLAAILFCTVTTTPPQATTLNNPPTAPTGVKGALVAGSGVMVSWTPSPEPDVAGYRVFRQDGSLACQASFDSPTPDSCPDTGSGGGTFTYHVVAYRWGGSYDPAQQTPSPNSSASPSVTVPGPPATTTTVKGTTSTTLPPFGPGGFTPKPVPGAVGAGAGAGAGGKVNFHAVPGTPAAAGADTPAGGDTGFLPNLPYGQVTTTTLPSDQSALPAPLATKKGKTSVGTIAVIGAGLLIAVIALHGLWLRSEVRRTGALEALDPEA